MTISDRALAWLLGMTLLLGGLTNFSPLLHLVIRHGSLDLAEAHLHPKTQDLPRLQVTASRVTVNSNAVVCGDHFPSPNPSQKTSRSDDSDPAQESSDSTNHDHHGLPELLQWGMLDIADSNHSLVPALVGTTNEQPHPTSFSLASAFDPVVAPRPPPFRTGLI